jgi:hypothetical protein
MLPMRMGPKGMMMRRIAVRGTSPVVRDMLGLHWTMWGHGMSSSPGGGVSSMIDVWVLGVRDMWRRMRVRKWMVDVLRNMVDGRVML